MRIVKREAQDSFEPLRSALSQSQKKIHQLSLTRSHIIRISLDNRPVCLYNMHAIIVLRSQLTSE